jgi:hypothetical protein
MVAVALGFVVASGSLAAQRAPGRGAVPPDRDAAVTPGEILRMFDAYALLQAQEQLKIADDQYAMFLSRFKALQDARRRAMQERNRIIQELRMLVNAQEPDESQMKERLKGLDEADARTAADVRRAAEALDQVLDVRQQAKFRVFEQNMEQRKLELVTRARLANRAR